MSVNRSNPDQYQLRFPVGMRERIKKAARDSGLSMNAEIIDRLEKSFSFERKEYQFRAEIAELNLTIENADQELSELKKQLESRDRREIERLAEIKRLQADLQDKRQHNSSDDLSLRLDRIEQQLRTLAEQMQQRRGDPE